MNNINMEPSTSHSAESKLFDQTSKTYQSFVNVLLEQIKKGTVPVIIPRNLENDALEIWNASTNIAWSLRLADSSKQYEDQSKQIAQEQFEKITTMMNENSDFGLYVAYQVLSDSFENESELLSEEGVKLNPISEELQEILISQLIKSIRSVANSGQDSITLKMVNNLLNRATEYADLVNIASLKQPEKQIGNTYLRIKDLAQIAELKNELGPNDTFIETYLQPLEKLASRLNQDDVIRQLFLGKK